MSGSLERTEKSPAARRIWDAVLTPIPGMDVKTCKKRERIRQLSSFRLDLGPFSLQTP
jgi:hypothetical protein